MKKTIIRIAVCVVVFFASALIIGSIMNQGHNNMTMEMAPATLPMITMESGGVACNELHGNTVERDVAYQKDSVTLLGEGRKADFTVDTFGREVTGISVEVRSIDGSRLIENSEVTGWKADGKSFSVTMALKDLIDTNKDLTVGKPSTVLWKFCMPLFGSILFQQLYNIADSFVAGKFINNDALAAVGNSYEITLIFIAFAFGCNIGCSAESARISSGVRF